MSPRQVIIAGTGAVSAAGWGVPALSEAVSGSTPLPVITTHREGSRLTMHTRPVPKPSAPLPALRHPRLRRCSDITRYTTAAALEALGETRTTRIKEGTYQLGLIFAFMNGCVNYTNRFYGETLVNPGLASPILFPETVFNAPASHLAAQLGSGGMTCTLVGDSAQYLAGMELGIQWLLDKRVDGVLIAGGEELDWLSTEASLLFSKQTVISEGAGVLLLEAPEANHTSPRVQCITPAYTYAAGQTRESAWENMCQALPERSKNSAIIVQRGTAFPQEDCFQPDRVLGDALGAALALQCVFAVSLLECDYEHVQVLHLGSNQQAIGACFSRASTNG